MFAWLVGGLFIDTRAINVAMQDEHLDENEKFTAERAYEAEMTAEERPLLLNRLALEQQRLLQQQQQGQGQQGQGQGGSGGGEGPVRWSQVEQDSEREGEEETYLSELSRVCCERKLATMPSSDERVEFIKDSLFNKFGEARALSLLNNVLARVNELEQQKIVQLKDQQPSIPIAQMAQQPSAQLTPKESGAPLQASGTVAGVTAGGGRDRGGHCEWSRNRRRRSSTRGE